MGTSRQDRQGVRTAAELERRHNFGKTFAELQGIANDAQTHAYKAEEIAERVEKKYLNLNVVNELNVSAGTITLKSKGLVIESTGFTLSEEKGIEATKGTIGGCTFEAGKMIVPCGQLSGKIVATQIDTQNLVVNELKTLGTDGSIVEIKNGSLVSNNGNKYAKISSGIFYLENGIYASEYSLDSSGNANLYGSKNVDIGCGSTGVISISPKLSTYKTTFGLNGIQTLYSNGVELCRFMIGTKTDFLIYGAEGITISGGRTSYLDGTWQTGSGTVITSDRNAKNTISDLSEKYSTLFDSLRPVTFKYNDGTSGRLHTGFIAQEVAEAAETAGLSLDEFAGVCIEGKGTEKESWGVRYAEIVPLNTLEIQKLKRRIAELENIMREKTYA